MIQGLNIQVNDRHGFPGRNTEAFAEMQETHVVEDETLLVHIAGGEEGAFAELVRRHSQRFYRIAYRFSTNREEAQDIVQEAFLKLWERPQLFKVTGKTRFTTWFYRVVINLCIDYSRRPGAVELTDDMMNVPDTGITPDVAMDARRMQVYLEHCIAQLPLRQRMALNLCFYEGVSNKDAAEIIGVSLKALQSLLMRAKGSLKEKMASYHGGTR
ncbi:MAG: sigma-70 family RNA polymerase sigma factor [Candidatus Magnetobacterium sp. LHC-1]|uniref:Sigma-70 family RNA polymerase sigma factor n=1 Tax=Candidatus Magnetobacterium casense TaxID=1455061 RepID=A0ABS6S4R0_9BACT|nr:sigma-70 family RNA polymerase sigma factor [Candidatus Magnetobacterium casensis]MBV6343359.1 sigma-70 family RNA polymerase sigma factor [Candidatus Magnetobacterium casensis]